MLNAFESFEECEGDRKFTNKRFLNHRALVRVQQIRKQLAKFIGRWRIKETATGDNVFPILKVSFNANSWCKIKSFVVNYGRFICKCGYPETWWTVWNDSRFNNVRTTSRFGPSRSDKATRMCAIHWSNARKIHARGIRYPAAMANRNCKSLLSK